VGEGHGSRSDVGTRMTGWHILLNTDDRLVHWEENFGMVFTMERGVPTRKMGADGWHGHAGLLVLVCVFWGNIGCTYVEDGS